MFVKFTNAFGPYAGDPVYINVNQVTSIFEDHTEGGSLITILFCINHERFQVEESLTEVMKKIEGAKNDRP